MPSSSPYPEPPASPIPLGPREGCAEPRHRSNDMLCHIAFVCRLPHGKGDRLGMVPATAQDIFNTFTIGDIFSKLQAHCQHHLGTPPPAHDLPSGKRQCIPGHRDLRIYLLISFHAASSSLPRWARLAHTRLQVFHHSLSSSSGKISTLLPQIFHCSSLDPCSS
uniref:Uncharacterized protein n=1 Tax=Arundo donax TaxID=35708 RepID=A0A0A9DCZ1_ARUDO